MNQITQESQNIEYKQSWRDEYLKWICGFANASGGKIYIGIDDDCHVVGVPDAKKLMEDIPNKIVNYLGIVADVNLLNEEDNDYIEINVSPSSVPISYRGVYHYRSGSTKQELNGSALQHFLLKRLGRTWDDLPCEWATFDDIDRDAVAYFFKKAASAKRVANNIADDDLQTVFQNLDLVTEEGKLKNATLLLFAKRPSRFFPLVQFKIGRFGKSDDDLMFQDIVEGNILQMADKVMDILKSKYLISPIHYEGLQRIESLEIPEESLREAIFNSIIHKDYTGAPIQLSVYNDKLILWNEGRLPEGFTIGTLLGKHPSRPYNKNIADIFFKAGFIEAWGRGISKIIEGFIQEGLKTPIFEATMGGIMVTIIRSEAIASTPQVPPKYPSSTPQVIQIIGSEDLAHKLLSLFKEKEECKLADISNALGLNDRKNLRELYLKPLLEAKILELKYPDVPNHPKQMYRLVAIK
jgi:ATP-dependent DNA helicase RecG